MSPEPSSAAARPSWRGQPPPVRARTGRRLAWFLRPAPSAAWAPAHVDRRTAARHPRRAHVALYAVSFLGFTGLLIWAWLWLSPQQPTAVRLVGAGYELDLAVPHNLYGMATIEDLTALEGERFRLVGEPTVLPGDADWDDGLNSISSNTLLIYWNVHGGADREGAYLLSSRGADSSRERVRVHAILDRIAKIPEQMNKLLILDATHFESEWFLGMLRNDFERRLSELEPRILRIPNLVVLSACSAGERSWVCPRWRRSVFGYYLRRGLETEDAAAGSVITAESIYDYLTRRVGLWARVNRGVAQTPVLLPKGAAGLARARRIVLGRVGARASRPLPAPVPVVIPASVADEWQARDRLRDQFPGAVLPALHAWRSYEAAIKRYEELCLGGATGHAEEMKRRVGSLRTAIGQLGRLELASRATSLAMDELQGSLKPAPIPATDMSAVDVQFERIWSEPSIDKAKAIWDGIKGQPGILRRYDERLLDRVVADPRSQLDKAIRLLRILHDDPRCLLPFEIHALAMFVRDRPASALKFADLYLPALSRALSVRRLAEQVALTAGSARIDYSDEIAPWIVEAVDAADRSRRIGEDLLFSSEPDRWRQAVDYLNRAGVGYQAAGRSANQLGTALAMRDRSLYELPEVTRWSSRLPIDALGGAIATKVAEAWPKALELAGNIRSQRLSETLVQAGASGRLPGVESLGKALDAIHQNVVAEVEVAKRSAQPRDQPRIAVGLELTSTRWEDRRELLQTWAGAVDATIDPAASIIVPGPAAGPADQWQRQEKLASASLGLPLVPAHGAEDPALAAGERVATRYEVLQFAARRSVGAAIRSLTTPGAATDMDAIRLELETATSLARLIPGSLDLFDSASSSAAVARPRLELPLTAAIDLDLAPEIALRDARLQTLLLRMADRSIGDHWADTGPETPVPYFRSAAGLFLADARALDLLAGDGLGKEARPADSAGLSRVTARLSHDEGPKLIGPSSATITSEPNIRLDYSVRASAEPPGATAGYATIWVDGVGRDLTVSEPDDLADRALVNLGAAGVESLSAPSTFQVTAASPLVGQAEATLQAPFPRTDSFLRVHALWRGRLLKTETPVSIRPVPDVTVALPSIRLPARLAVRADIGLLQALGRGRGGLAIVVDCSGSMGGPVRPTGATTKYQAVVDAVAGLLPEIPQGTQVSIWIFGQRLTPADTAADAERTIRPLLARTRWDPTDKATIGSLTAELKRQRPCNQSPVVRAMLKARDDLLGVDGPKTILALTDGMDNRFDLEQQSADRPLTIPEALREQFQNSGIHVDIVGFRITPEDWARAYEQFSVVRTLPAAGRFLRVDDPRALDHVVRSGLPAEVRYLVETLTGSLVSGIPSGGQDVAAEGSPDRFLATGIEPGTYRLQLPGDSRPGQEIRLAWNDMLILRLMAPAGSPRAVLEDVLRTDYGAWPYRRAGGWGAAVLGNSAGPAGGLSLLVGIARTPAMGEPTLRQHRPTDPWFAIRPRSGESATIPIRWCLDPAYPIPVYQVRLPQWPRDPATGLPASATIRGWWLPEGASAGPGIELRRGVEFRSLADLVRQSYSLAGKTVVVEDIAIERHTVETKPSVLASLGCLAIRLRCDEAQAVRVAPRGIEFEGSEHRYYAGSSRCTALFWPVTGDQLKERPEGLVLHSIAGLVPQAEAAGCAVIFDDLPPPASGAPTASPPAIEPAIKFPELLPAALPDHN
jgi:hypothetical protein